VGKRGREWAVGVGGQTAAGEAKNTQNPKLNPHPSGQKTK